MSRMGWAVTLGGRRFQGRPLSGEAVRQYERRTAADPTQQEAALFRLLRLAFPLRWAVVWRGDPTRKLMAMPPSERSAVLRDFFGSRRSSPCPRGRRMTGIDWKRRIGIPSPSRSGPCHWTPCAG